MARASGPHFALERLAPGVHAAIAIDGRYAMCNAGIIDLGGITVVFDAMLTPMAGADLARAARRLTGRPPDVVVYSHWHGDHVRGARGFPPVRIASTRRTRELLARLAGRAFAEERRVFREELARGTALGRPVPAGERAMFEGWFRGVLATPRPFRVALPDLTFDSSLTLVGDRRSVELTSLGGGHSPSDLFAQLPDERVVFLGDLANVGMHPSVGDGHPQRWRGILSQIARRRPTTIVPGHGAVSGPRVLGEVDRYLGDLQRIARRHRSAPGFGWTAEEPVPARYRRWRFAAFFGENLRRAARLDRRGAGRRRSRGPA